MPLRLLPRGCCAGWFGRGVTLDRFDRHRPFAGHEHRVELGGQLLNTAQPVCANGGGRFAGKVRRPSLEVTPGGRRRAGPTEKRPFEVRAPSGIDGGNPGKTAQPVCANGGGRFAGKVRRPSLEVTPGGRRRAGPTEKRPFEVRAPSGIDGGNPGKTAQPKGFEGGNSQRLVHPARVR
jgi:hypothetical protein